MNVVELHPEELIDKEARGGLDAAAVARLEAHCVRCVACRYERTMRAQFAGTLGDRELEEEPERKDEHEDRAQESPLVRGSGWRRAWVWVAVASSIIGGAHLMAPEPEQPLAPRAVRAVTFERASVDARAPRARQALAKYDALSACMSPTPAALFEHANRARLHGHYAEALETYRRLQQRFPASQEARVSYVAMGRMQLDRADAAGALASFNHYEAWGNVDVDAVVMAGRALALDELGAEASSLAWAALLASHPETPYAEHARLRVAARSM